MKDSVILGSGNSRYLKSVADFKTLYPTYDDFAAALVAGTLPIDFNGINSAGFQQVGDALGKDTLLKDETAALFGMDDTALPDDVFRHLVESAFVRRKTKVGEEIDAIFSQLPVDQQKYNVCYGNGVYVSVVYNSKIALYSHDAKTWEQTTLPDSLNWYNVVYGNGVFVAVANNSSNNKGAYSYDGVTWTRFYFPKSYRFRSIAFGNGRFVAVADNANYSAYSEDGINWVSGGAPGANMYTITFADGKFVAGGSDEISVSEDGGLTWTLSDSILNSGMSSINGIAYGNGVWVITYGSGDKPIVISQDLSSFESVDFSTHGYFSGLCFGNGKFFMFESSSTNLRSSEDGRTWEIVQLPISANDWSMCFDGKAFCAMPRTGVLVAYGTLETKNVYLAENVQDVLGDFILLDRSVEVGTYVGTGTTSKTLTFSSAPKLVIVTQEVSSAANYPFIAIFAWGQSKIPIIFDIGVDVNSNSNYALSLSYSGYSVSMNNGNYALNKSNGTYYYVAIY